MQRELLGALARASTSFGSARRRAGIGRALRCDLGMFAADSPLSRPPRVTPQLVGWQTNALRLGGARDGLVGARLSMFRLERLSFGRLDQLEVLARNWQLRLLLDIELVATTLVVIVVVVVVVHV